MSFRLQRGGWRIGEAERDFHTGIELVDKLVEMSLDDAVVVKSESFAHGVLGDFETAVHIASQGGGKEEADRQGEGLGSQPFREGVLQG